ncbi:hypothetical protein AB0891_25430 [Streptomyces sp. NPDC007259]|uniref:hypothetical protein n=1 Tax=Streptomyces sp. NPDC007259 TaxID=3154319 RepID=UPI003454D60D
MTGPEHYREAERHLSAASFTTGPIGDVVHPKGAAHHLAMAQVHATLALAAATALVDETPRSDSHSEYRAWSNVAGSPYQIPGDAA